jgi:hypothetical protein
VALGTVTSRATTPHFVKGIHKMARDSKGTRVKSFTAYPPGLDLDGVKTVVPIYFHAGESDFSAVLPEHIAQCIDRHPECPSGMRDGRVRAPLVDDIESIYKGCCKLYERIQQHAVRKKVIKVHVQANHPTTGFPPGFAFQDVSFSAVPALTMQYRVLWQVDDGLYDADNNPNREGLAHMTFISRVPEPNDKPYQTQSTFVIDWTQEREDFFASMKEGLIELIRRIAWLLADNTGVKIDQLLASGNAGLLPAPDGQGT